MDSERQAKVTVQVTYSKPSTLSPSFFWPHESWRKVRHRIPVVTPITVPKRTSGKGPEGNKVECVEGGQSKLWG